MKGTRVQNTRVVESDKRTNSSLHAAISANGSALIETMRAGAQLMRENMVIGMKNYTVIAFH